MGRLDWVVRVAANWCRTPDSSSYRLDWHCRSRSNWLKPHTSSRRSSSPPRWSHMPTAKFAYPSGNFCTARCIVRAQPRFLWLEAVAVAVPDLQRARASHGGGGKIGAETETELGHLPQIHCRRHTKCHPSLCKRSPGLRLYRTPVCSRQARCRDNSRQGTPTCTCSEPVVPVVLVAGDLRRATAVCKDDHTPRWSHHKPTRPCGRFRSCILMCTPCTPPSSGGSGGGGGGAAGQQNSKS